MNAKCEKAQCLDLFSNIELFENSAVCGSLAPFPYGNDLLQCDLSVLSGRSSFISTPLCRNCSYYSHSACPATLLN